jgi:PPK2 family polyphosphate:nucleotide phosphotransferase
MSEGFIKQFRVPAGGKGWSLESVDAADRGKYDDKEKALAEFDKDVAKLNELQEVLYAQNKHAVLVVFQAMDTAGKDGVVRSVFGPLNSQGCVVTSFKKPSALELSHDYLWRIHAALPPKGSIGIFNRSHYEDVLVTRVHGLVKQPVIDERYEQINQFERYLSGNGVCILKFFLHISKEEQKERLQARLDDPNKHWKFTVSDVAERKLWPKYMDAYEAALGRCSTSWAPWYVIPANRKWYRNVVVARIVRRALEGLDMSYPKADPAIAKLRIPN